MNRRAMRAILGIALLAGIGSAANAQQVLINGGGATFPNPIYSKWFDEYHKKFASIQINYQSQGSSFGIQQIIAGTVDFGASDAPMSDAQMTEFKTKRGSGILHFPTVMGGNVPIYNVPGVPQQLNFTGDALAGIFLGKITKWSDPELTKSNPGVKLPDASIVVVHRSDGSGTSYVWTDYLSKVSKEWETKVGRGNSVNWPVGLGGKGSEGVTGQVKQQPNSIGYVEVIYAQQNKLTYGKVKNLAGNFVDGSLQGVTAAAAGSNKEIPDDFRVSITNAPGKDSYPISTFTWLLIPEKITDPAKKKAIKDFVVWALKDGQNLCEPLSFARLPKAVVDKEVKAIAKIQ
ncbi:MAG TPA: phosphate ABC transporter substrate-binding protein PstS [Bryobacteraceae bacterium]|jgi:phosphate transport system substrate-binding protein|nr:phosphate ABC transporter substrate-binding protein PstS [Bryobacteraceae bacterium]HWZ29830.1 phosphate ABC transporter substrate-binding protein PstS [Bryobacteraceae bacterium]